MSEQFHGNSNLLSLASVAAKISGSACTATRFSCYFHFKTTARAGTGTKAGFQQLRFRECRFGEGTNKQKKTKTNKPKPGTNQTKPRRCFHEAITRSARSSRATHRHDCCQQHGGRNYEGN